jgi:hypothetical protein
MLTILLKYVFENSVAYLILDCLYTLAYLCHFRQVYNLDLNDLPLDRLSERAQKKKRGREGIQVWVVRKSWVVLRLLFSLNFQHRNATNLLSFFD